MRTPRIGRPRPTRPTILPRPPATAAAAAEVATGAEPRATPGKLNKSRTNFLTVTQTNKSPSNVKPGTNKVTKLIQTFNSAPTNTRSLRRGPKINLHGSPNTTGSKKKKERPVQTPADNAKRAKRKEQRNEVNEALRVFNEVKNTTPNPNTKIPQPVPVPVEESMANVLKTSSLVRNLRVPVKVETASVEAEAATAAATATTTATTEGTAAKEAPVPVTAATATATALAPAAAPAEEAKENVPEFDPSASVVGVKNTQGKYMTVDSNNPQTTAPPRLPGDAGYMDVIANKDNYLKVEPALPTNYLQVEPSTKSNTSEQFNSPEFVKKNTATTDKPQYLNILATDKIPEYTGYITVKANNVNNVNKDNYLLVGPGENTTANRKADTEAKAKLRADTEAEDRISSNTAAANKKLDAINQNLLDANKRISQQTPSGNDIKNYFNRLEKDTTQTFSKEQLTQFKKEKEAIDTEAKKQSKPPDYTGFWGRLRGAFATLGKYRDEELEIETRKRDKLAQEYEQQKYAHAALKANQEAMAQALAEPTINSFREATAVEKAEAAEAKATATGGFRKSRTKKSFFKKNRTKKSFFKKNRTKKSFSNKAGFKKSRTYKLFNKRNISNKQRSARG